MAIKNLQYGAQAVFFRKRMAMMGKSHLEDIREVLDLLINEQEDRNDVLNSLAELIYLSPKDVRPVCWDCGLPDEEQYLEPGEKGCSCPVPEPGPGDDGTEPGNLPDH